MTLVAPYIAAFITVGVLWTIYFIAMSEMERSR